MNDVEVMRKSWQRGAQLFLSTWKNLHTAVVEFGLGDSATKELGKELIHADNVPIEEANAMGSYIVGSATKENVVYGGVGYDFLEKHSDGTPDKRTGKHRVLLDLDCQHVYVPSSSTGHGHLIIDVPQDWSNLCKLLQLLGDMHILQYGFVDATFSRGETWLRTPGTEKTIQTEGL